ncbi:amino acid adenylation domain-containing protein [Streptomyces sp. NPDC087440]|uniref:non-ribosomal peptide synthetase n=1 Tax=Streptomyces sp. NPDC087440 TaxID=3365790 RepID=UPI0038260E95
MTAYQKPRHSTPESPRGTTPEPPARGTAAERHSDTPSPAQQRLWLLGQLQRTGRAHHVAVELTGTLDRGALSRALDALIDRHEVLRTRFATVAGAPHRRVAALGTGWPLAVRDLSALRDIDVAEQLRAVEHEMAREPLDLAVDLPVRGCLVVLGAERHVLLLTLHHIAVDRWSVRVLRRDLSALYGAFRGGASGSGGAHGSGRTDASDGAARSLVLPELSGCYADHAARQQEWLDSDAAEAQRAHWRETLAAMPEVLELPTDRPRPAEQDHRGGRVPVLLDRELTAALAEFSRREGCAVSDLVLAGWALVLGKHAGQEDLVIGAPTPGRGRTAEEHAARAGLVGPFDQLLPLRVDLAGRPTAAALVRRVRDVVQAAEEHAELPFEQLVNLVGPARSMARTPLFQVLYAWQEERSGPEGAEWALPGLRVTPRQTACPTAVFDLALSLREADGCVEGELDFASALFDRATAELCVRHVRQVLAQLAAFPERPADELPLLDQEERRQVLLEFNDTFLANDERGLVERFEAQVRERPEQTAVVHLGERLDYAALDRRVNRLAHALLARGVTTDTVVGLHTELSVDMVVGILGVLKAGGAYLPLDPALPAERLAGMVEDSGATVVLTNVPVPYEGWLSVSALSAGSGGTGDAGDTAPRVPAARPEDLAYVIYTSGSTGRPKGVAATHRGILNLLDHWTSEFGTTPGLPSAMWPYFSFDASVQEFLLPLTTGGELHLVPQDVRDDPGELMAWLDEQRIVDVLLPPAFVKWICEAPDERLGTLALRCIRTGLQPLSEESLYRMERALPGLRVLNGYGPTETALYCTSYLGPRPLARQAPIGRPVANTRTYVLDERREPVAIGVTGELYIAGAGLARGYLNSPGLTAERFVPDPFVPGERMYRSGDLARWLPEGNLLYVGRGDHQIKLRGFRVELGEIEAALLDEPGVTQAAVLTDLDASGEPYVVAATVTRDGSGCEEPTAPGAHSAPGAFGDSETAGASDAPTVPRTPAQWRAALARRLPSHMIPAFFVELPHLPQTPNGKLDRTAVLEAARVARPSQVNQESPRDQIELTLYQIWRGLLLHPDIGIRDSFFDIGGTSISAIKLAHALREEFGRSLPVRDLLLHPTIEELGGLLRRTSSGPPPSNLLTFRPGEPGHGQVVCVHPAGGTAFCYLSLAKSLPDAFGVHGIQSPGVNPGESFLPSVDAMAAAYLQLIEPLLADDGPLVLTGLSYGGLVAHEMGRLLAAAGRDRLSVVLLDTPGSDADDDPAARAAAEPVDLAEFRSKLIRFNGMYPGIDDAQIEQFFHLYNHNRRTTVDHSASVTAARTVLIQAAEGATAEELDGVRSFWQRRAGGSYTVQTVGCGHWDMLESAELPRVAATIEAELARSGAVPGSVLGAQAGTVAQA